jgi:hypothetical protein
LQILGHQKGQKALDRHMPLIHGADLLREADDLVLIEVVVRLVKP